MSDITIAQPIEYLNLAETSFNAKIYTNEFDNPLSLVSRGIQYVKVEDDFREVQTNNLIAVVVRKGVFWNGYFWFRISGKSKFRYWFNGLIAYDELEMAEK